MRRQHLIAAMMILGFCVPVAPAGTEDVVTFESLLNEMIDRDRVAMVPTPDYRLGQQSSFDPRSKTTPDDPEGWFANRDAGHFIRTETHNERQEWVLMEHQGPGAMARSWMPDPRITPVVMAGTRKPPKNLGTLRVYVDGQSEPVLEGSPYDLFNGTTIAPYPFGHKSRSSAVSFLPIPWAKSCKITMDVKPHYYIFTYRAYAEGTKVESFTLADLKAAEDQIQRVAKTLTNPRISSRDTTNAMMKTIAPGQEASITLPNGTNAIRKLMVQLGSYDDPQVTRSMVLKVEFDGQETIWCPVGDFFGTGVGLHPFQGWYRTVRTDGAMSCRWVMPYRKSAKVTLLNLYDKPVQVVVNTTVAPWKWNDRSMYFHANWRHEADIETRPHSDWNYVTLKGQGVYVGDTLTIWNPIHKWWGEGDGKVWGDGESFPSLWGTGTEDYYAYSYGGRNRKFYEHPFHAQVRARYFDRNYRSEVFWDWNTKGYNTETRTRALDAMPFDTSLRVDVEIWHVGDCQVNYNVGTYWYGRPGTTCNVTPLPAAAKRKVKTQPTD